MSQSNKNEPFWIENPCILITNFCRFNPLSNGTLSYNMNSYTRFIIILMVIYIYMNVYLCMYIYI